MRRIFFVILLLFGSFFFLLSQKMALAEECATSSAWSQIKINEFSSYSASDDWVELFNVFDSCVNLGGLSLFDSASAFKSLNAIAEVAGRGYYVVDANNRLNKDGDSIVLKNGELELDWVDYGTESMPAAKENEFWVKNGGNLWVLSSSSTPGSTNFFMPLGNEVGETPTTTTEGLATEPVAPDIFAWGQLRINEAMIDPDDGRDEWVELYNAATTSIDLTGGILCDSRENDCEIAAPSSTIAAGGYVVLSWSGSKLNNDTDKVIWKNPIGTVVDQMEYGIGEVPTASDGKSLARNEAGEWGITLAATPGERNIIQLPPAPVASGGGGGSGGSSTADNAKTSAETKSKTAKSATSTTKVKEDSVKIVWKVKFPSQGAPEEPLSFDASDSADPRGGLLRIIWNFGDETILTGGKVLHSYATSGVFAVTVLATSTAGTVGEKKISVRIASGLATKNTGVKISEVMVNPEGADSREFIRLYNSSSSTVDLSGWKLIYKDKEYILPAKTNILPADSLIFFQAVTHFMLENTTGGKIELLTPDEAVANVFSFGKALEGQSFTSTSTLVAAQKIVKKITTKKVLLTMAMSLTEAREAAKDTPVKVRGTVAALPGSFGVQYFYLIDGATGIQVYQYKKLFPAMKVGDVVEVKGVTSVASGIKRIKVSKKEDISVRSVDATSSSTAVTLEELDEELAGALVKITGEVTEIKSNFMYVDDGTTEAVVYFKKGAKIDKKKFQEGELVEVEGVLEQAKSSLQIWPRNQNDIRVIGQSEDLLKKQVLTSVTANPDTAEKYLTATAGGITTLLLGFLAKARGAAVRGLVRRGASLVTGIIRRDKV